MQDAAWNSPEKHRKKKNPLRCNKKDLKEVLGEKGTMTLSHEPNTGIAHPACLSILPQKDGEEEQIR